MSEEHDAAALWAAERTRTPVAPPSERVGGLSVAEAYAIQLRGRALRERAGARVVGRKIGLTSVAMQQLLGVEEPDFGYLTDAMVLGDEAVIDRRTLIAPRVEAEIAFRLSSSLRGADVDRRVALAAIGEVAPSLEVVDSRVADWRITLADTIADNASSGLAVIGAFRPLAGLELADVAMTMDVAHADGTHERELGTGAAVLDHPAEALAWLVRALAPYGEGIEAGEVVIPGAMARAVSIQAGATVEARFSDLGSVRVTFTDAGET